MTIDDRYRALASSDLFGRIDPEILKEAVEGTSIVRAAGGSDLVAQDSEADQTFVLLTASG